MAYCTRCGGAVADKALFCSKCGESLSQPAAVNELMPYQSTSVHTQASAQHEVQLSPGAPQALAPYPKSLTSQPQPHARQMIAASHSGQSSPGNQPQDKSVVVALLLMLFFGAFGLFYIARWWVALLLIVVEVLVGVFTIGIGLLILHPVLCVWACVVASRRHSEFQATMAYIQSPRG